MKEQNPEKNMLKVYMDSTVLEKKSSIILIFILEHTVRVSITSSTICIVLCSVVIVA